MRIRIHNTTCAWEKFVQEVQNREGLQVSLEEDGQEADLTLYLQEDGQEAVLPAIIQDLFPRPGADLWQTETKKMLEAIIHSVQDAISVVDETGVGILINPAYTKITGLTPEDVIGRPATVDIAEGESMHYQVLNTGKPVFNVPLKVGPKKREVIVNVAPLIIGGQIKGSVGVIHDISEIKKLTEELNRANQMLRHLRARYTFADIIGSSQAMQQVSTQAKKASATPATVLIRGESGTGKELFAHAIHNESKRKEGQFIRVNCPAIPSALMESELFGYVEGAFTGARSGGKKGLFEEAHHGTIFLDEIAKMDYSLQDKLLRVLQEREFSRVGSAEPIQVDVRIIAATNADLEELVRRGAFREDLYYRLNVFPLEIPPLRHRREDIPALAYHLIRRFNQEYGRVVEECSHKALEILKQYSWPGNVRELENAIGRAMIEVDLQSRLIEAQHLPPLGLAYQLKHSSSSNPESIPSAQGTLKEVLANTEKEVLKETLEKTGGNRQEAARYLGIALRSLYYKLNRHGLTTYEREG